MRFVLCRITRLAMPLILLSVSLLSSGQAWSKSAVIPLRAPRQAGLDSTLADLGERLRATDSDGLRAWLWSARPRLVSGRIQVHLIGDPLSATLVRIALQPAGGLVTGEIVSEGLVQAWVPLQAVTLLATLPGVQFVRQPDVAHLHSLSSLSSAHTEALSAMGATSWHDAGYRGEGVRVGIIDLGYTGYPALLGTELPSQVGTRNFVDGQGGTDVDTGPRHGTAVAEIVHDVAPGAELYLAKILTRVDLVEAVDWLLSENVQVINTSLGWYDVSSGDGTGFFADQVARVRAAGSLWVTSAGDERQRHWCGDWGNPEDGETLWFSPDDRVNWLRSNGDYVIPPGTRIQLYLRWSDWEFVDQDYDLYLWEYGVENPVPHIVASSTKQQSGLVGQTPTESLTYDTSLGERLYAAQVKAYSVSRDIHLDLFLPGRAASAVRCCGAEPVQPCRCDRSRQRGCRQLGVPLSSDS